MEANPLHAQITQALRDAESPLRAVDIARILVAAGTPANKEAVNKALYSGPFERIEGAGAPTWKLREAPSLADGDALPRKDGHYTFQVDGVGAFYLRDGLAEEQVSAFLAAVAALTPAGTVCVVRVDLSAGGQLVRRLAEKHGIVVRL